MSKKTRSVTTVKDKENEKINIKKDNLKKGSKKKENINSNNSFEQIQLMF